MLDDGLICPSLPAADEVPQDMPRDGFAGMTRPCGQPAVGDVADNETAGKGKRGPAAVDEAAGQFTVAGDVASADGTTPHVRRRWREVDRRWRVGANERHGTTAVTPVLVAGWEHGKKIFLVAAADEAARLPQHSDRRRR